MRRYSDFSRTKSYNERKGVVVDLTEQGSIDDQAAKWIAKLDFDEPSKETLAAFKQWINQSPEHREAAVQNPKLTLEG